MREAAHVQALDVTVAVYAHLALERHPLIQGRRRRLFRVVGVLLLGVVVQVLRRRNGGPADDRLQGRGPHKGRAPAQHERLPGRGLGRRGRGHLLLLLLLLRLRSRRRRERVVVRPERERRIRKRLERAGLER